jgi:hypothetical protein
LISSTAANSTTIASTAMSVEVTSRPRTLLAVMVTTA